MIRKLFIVGAGMGSPDLLSVNALKTIKDCGEVYAFKRMAHLLSPIRDDINVCELSVMKNALHETKSESVAVCVSGDVGFFSMAKMLTKEFSDFYEIILICGVNSLQYFCSKIGCGYEDILVLSLHGKNCSITGPVSYSSKVFLLTGGNTTASDIIMDLYNKNLTHLTVTAGEFLSMPQERIIKGNIKELLHEKFDDLTVLLIENNKPANKDMPLFDKDFVRNKTPMTKEEIRWISVNSLCISPEDIVYDIGAGSASVSLEMARKAWKGIVYSIEHDKEALEIMNQNIKNLGGYNVFPINNKAPLGLEDLPAPDKVFIGGSGGNLQEIINVILSKNPNVLFVINAITLETLSQTTQIFKDLDFDMKIVQINSSRNRLVGDYNLMTANNPVYIITGGPK